MKVPPTSLFIPDITTGRRYGHPESWTLLYDALPDTSHGVGSATFILADSPGGLWP
jgi:hypothetical protein